MAHPVGSPLLAHVAPLLGVAVSTDGQRLAVCARDRTAKVFLSATREETHILTHSHADRVTAVAFGGPRLLATAARDRCVRLWLADSGHLERTLRGHAADVLCLAFAPGGRLLASGGADRDVFLWETRDGTLLRRLQDHTGSVLACAFSPPGRRFLVSGSDDCLVKLWNTQTGKLLRTLGGHGDAITATRFSTLDGHIVVSASRDTTIRVWHVDTAEPLAVLQGHTDVVSCIAFSPDGWLLASVSADCTLRLWSVADGKEVLSFQAHKKSISGCAFRPDVPTVYTAASDGTVREWDVEGIATPGTSPFNWKAIAQSVAESDAAVEASSPHHHAHDDSHAKAQLSPPQHNGHGTRSRDHSPARSRDHSPAPRVRGTVAPKEQSRVHGSAHTAPRSTGSSEGHAGSRNGSRTDSRSGSRTGSQGGSRRNSSDHLPTESAVTSKTPVKEQAAQAAAINNTADLAAARAQLAKVRKELEIERSTRLDLQEKVAALRHVWQLNFDQVTVSTEFYKGPTSTSFHGHYFGAEVAAHRFHEVLRSEYYVKIWEQEMELRAQLRHPNIVDFYGVVLELKQPAVIVTELCEGSAHELTRLGQSLTCRELCDIAHGVASALHYLHARQLPHGSLTPDHILLTRRLQPKISSWGVAACVRATFLTPPSDLPPTAVLYATDPDATSAKMSADIYAFGSLLTELCNLRGFEDPTQLEHAATSIPWEPIKVLVQRCLLADVEDRPSAALLEDLMHKLTTPGAWPDYGECAPVRNVKRTVYGLGFDTAARIRKLPAPPS